MTPTPAAAASARSRLRVALAAAALALGGLYLAGWVFLWAIGAPPREATPLTTLRYAYWHGARADVRAALGWGLAAGLGAAAAALALALRPRAASLHGDARWASAREIRAAGLLGHEGILLGKYRGRFLTLPGQQGVELEAPPRSGKGAGLVIPNLLNWPGSVVVNDIKGENWARTAGWRSAHGHGVHLFDPLAADERSARWNPLAYVATDAAHRTIDDLQRIATMLYPDPQGADPFWSTSARSLFLGIALYLFETPGATRTLGEVLRQGMASDAEGFQRHWRRVVEACERAGYALSPQTVQILYDVIDLAPVTASSIRKTFTSRLDLWMNPLIDAATSANDFDFRELRRRPVSIYCRIDPDNIARLQPLLNLFFQQAVGLQTKTLPEHDPALRVQLLLLMDEFRALGRLPVIADSTAFLPGYNVRTVIVVQSHSQIVEAYGPEGARSLRKMLAARIVFPPREVDDAEAISRELGTRTVRARSRSQRAFDTRGATVSTSEVARRLLLPQEVKELGRERLILFYEGLRPVLGERMWYWRDRRFARRERAPPEVPRLDVAAALRAARAAHPPAQGEPAEHARQAAGAVSAAPVSEPGSAAPRRLRPDELHRLDALALEDFSLDFGDVPIPAGGPLTDAEIDRAVDAFLATCTDDP